MIFPWHNITPSISPSAYIAPGAYVTGRVTVGDQASIWSGAVIRGDVNEIIIGNRTNIQDGSVLHVADECRLVVGDYVTAGHAVNLHGCTIADGALIGIGAIILNGAFIGKNSVVGAGALVPEGEHIPEGVLAVGIPARVVRKLTQKEMDKNIYWAEKYVKIQTEYKKSHSSA